MLLHLSGIDRFKLEARRTEKVKHHIHKNSVVVFRVGSQEEDGE
jgi:hypothetical protein